MLNLIARLTLQGLEYEAGPRQCEKLLRDLKLDGGGVKHVGAPGVKATKDQHDTDAEVTPAQATPYREVAARATYLSADSLGIQFAAKEIARRMASPRQGDLALPIRLAKYLVGAPRVKY